MAVNKYLGPTGLTELINLIQADFQKKQDWIQFPEMPAAAEYVGKVVQYTGITNNTYTKGFFYYSTGLEWIGISVASAVETVATLPAWSEGKDGVIYYVTSEHVCYVRSSTEGEWLPITDGDNKSFEIVNALPAYDAADPKIIYMVVGDDDIVTGYIKDANITGKFYQLGGGSGDIEQIAVLPAWDAADSDTLYLIPDENGLLSAYKKDPNTTGKFFELSGNYIITTEDIENIFNEVFGY